VESDDGGHDDDGDEKQTRTLPNPSSTNQHASTGYIGVYKPSRPGEGSYLSKWRARIYYDGKSRSLGVFDSGIEAARKYDEAAKIHHHVNTRRLNFPDSDSDDEDDEKPTRMSRGQMKKLYKLYSMDC